MTTNPIEVQVNIQQDDPLIDRYISFIDSFDGSPEAFDRAEPIMGKLFHPKFQFHADDGIKNLRWYTDFARSFAEQGHCAKVVHARRTCDAATMEVSILNVIDGIDMDLIWYRASVVIDPTSRESLLIDFAPMSTTADVDGLSELVRHVAEWNEKERLDSLTPFTCMIGATAFTSYASTYFDRIGENRLRITLEGSYQT